MKTTTYEFKRQKILQERHVTEITRKKINLRVKRYFQKWLLIRIFGVTLLCSLVAAFILYFYARSEITSSFFDAHIKIRRVSDLLLPVVISGSLISFVSGVILSLFLPQKIAGPLFRIEQDLKPVQEGDLTLTIKLRKGDILKELAEEVNKATIQTHDRVQKTKSALEELIKAMDGGSSDSEMKARIRDLHNTLAQLKTG